MPFYTQTTEQALNELNVTENGLPISDAEERLAQYGPNAIRVEGEPLWRKLIEPFANVFMLVLFIAIVISIAHNAKLDAVIIGAIMAVSAGIYYVQRFSTERILRSLQKHNKQTVEVLRDGKVAAVESSFLVPGDVIMLSEGEKIPADARLLKAVSLRVDEAQLTGESLPIDKQTDPLTGDKEVYERSNMLFQGSFVIAGEATAVVTTTGNDTEFGRLAALTKDAATNESPVQRKIDALLTQIIIAITAVSAVAFGLSLMRGMELGESLSFVIALAVSAVPESLPVAISVVLVLAMRRMASKKALVRTMRAIETVGVITTIATDKTGTLTKNKLTVQAVWQPAHAGRRLAALLPSAINYRKEKLHDPLDTAMHNYILAEKVAIPRHQPAVSIPFDQEAAMSGNVWHHGNEYELVVKGAPEHVLARSDLTESEHETATAQLHKLTGEGYRVIALAHTPLKRQISNFHELGRKDKLTFCGFVAIADVLRPEAKRAIRTAVKAGVTVRMITGDHFETAYHIGRELGMVTKRDQVFDTRKMHTMSDEDLEKVIDEIRVFSRVIPEHKYRILNLLKKHNITAMTGDGVNDVPALANAHVGIAMGSGAAIAKDAGDIILLDDNFKSIVDAMHEGRTVTGNIRRMLYYLLATSTGEAITMVSALIVNIPIPLAPVQILWVNLVTDSAMVIPLGLEPGKRANMTDIPRRLTAPILSKFMITRIALIASMIAVLILSFYTYFSAQHGHEYARTIAFSALVVIQWSSAFTARSDYESLFSRLRVFNGKFYAGLLIAVTVQMLALFGPLGQFLHVTPVAATDLLVTGIIAFMGPVLVTEVHKYIGRRYFQKGSENQRVVVPAT